MAEPVVVFAVPSAAVSALLSTFVVGAVPTGAVDAVAADRTGSLTHFSLSRSNCDVVLAHSEKAADPKVDVLNLAGLVENKLPDITDVFVGFAAKGDANERGRVH